MIQIDNTRTTAPDFWSRQHNAPAEQFSFGVMGVPVTITANQPQILAAARLSAQRFSQAALQEGTKPISLQICVAAQPAQPAPADLVEQLRYAGSGPWITLSAGLWGHAFANLDQQEALLFLSPELAGDIRLVSRYFIDHYVLNFTLTRWAMLHASSVCSADGQQLVMLVAPHNSGKSTTALRLLRAGYTFVADGMVLFQFGTAGFLVGGYPIGEVKLRDDVLSKFPEYTGQTVHVREQRKTVVDLRSHHPCQLAEKVLQPSQLHLCFVERSNMRQTTIESLTGENVWPLLLENTAFWDEAPKLTHNYAVLQELLGGAVLHRLQLGTDPDGIVVTVNALLKKS